MARFFQYQAKTEPVTVPTVVAATVAVAFIACEVFFPRSIIYQSRAEPILPPTETVTVDKWFEPLSEPVKFKVLPVAHTTTIGSGPVLPPPVLSSQWNYQWTDPVRVKIGIAASQQQSLAWGTTTPSAETITADKWLYQWSEPVRSKTIPTSETSGIRAQTIQPPDVLISQWFESWSEPTRLKITAHEQKTLAWGTNTPAAEVVTADKWIYPWSEPVRVKQGLLASEQQFFAINPTTPTAATVVNPSTFSSEVIFPKSIIYQSLAYNYFTPSAEVVTEDKWHQPWSEPVRSKNIPAAEMSGIKAQTIQPPTILVSQWAYGWSEPVRTKNITTADIAPSHAQTIQPPTILISQWFNPLSEPVRIKQGLLAALHQAQIDNVEFPILPPPPPPSTIVASTTSSSPVFYRGRFIYQSYVKPPFPPPAEVITTDKWFNPWSEPVRQRKSIAQQQDSAWSNFTPAFTDTRWIYPWSEPVRVRRLPVSDMAPARVQTIQPPTILVSQWFNPLSEPIKVKQLPVSEQQYLAWSNFTPPTVVFTGPFLNLTQGDTGIIFQKTIIYQESTEASSPETHVFWNEPWVEPVRIKQGLLASEQQFLALNPTTPAAETITADKWIYPWSEPVRIRGLLASEQQFLALNPTTPAVTPVTAVEVSTISSEVVFPRSIIYQSLAYNYFTPSAEVITVDKWVYPWSEPVRIRLGLPSSEQQSLTWINFTPTVNYDKWAFAWSEPVRIRLFPTNEQQSFAWGNFTPTAETITEDKWHYAWSEPVRIKLGLTASLQQPLSATLTPPIISFGYYGWLTEPVREKKGLKAHLQQSFTADTTVIPTSKIPTWLYGWSEPVRQKLGLRVALQQTTTPATPIFPNLNRLIQWFAPFTEPVRLKLGLQAWLQQIFTAGTKPITNVVNVTLDATETNSDTALFGISVYNRPTLANVSIKEIPNADTAYASIEET